MAGIASGAGVSRVLRVASSAGMTTWTPAPQNTMARTICLHSCLKAASLLTASDTGTCKGELVHGCNQLTAVSARNAPPPGGSQGLVG